MVTVIAVVMRQCNAWVSVPMQCYGAQTGLNMD